MSKLLERLKRERLERERKRAEREEKKRQKELERKRKEKARERRKATAPIRKKKQKSKENRRYYLKKRKVELSRRKKIGDVYAFHQIIIMRNNRRVKRIASAWWLTNAYEKYNAAIEENRRTVKFPLEITEQSEKPSREISRHAQKQKYEIMIIQRVKPGDETTAYLRDKDGRFIENVIVDDKDMHIIIAKDDWYMPETFHVYGYHPYKDRKDFDFILNELVLNNTTKNGIRRVFTFNNKLIVQYDLDFDFVVCKTPKEAKRLYETLEKYVDNCDYVFFTGELSRKLSTMMLNKMEEKTGWTRTNCKRATSI